MATHTALVTLFAFAFALEACGGSMLATPGGSLSTSEVHVTATDGSQHPTTDDAVRASAAFDLRCQEPLVVRSVAHNRIAEGCEQRATYGFDEDKLVLLAIVPLRREP